MSSHREREKRDRRDSSGDEREGQGRKENEWQWRNRRNKNIPPLSLHVARIAGIAQLWCKIHNTFASSKHPSLIMISCKMKNVHLNRAILVKCRKLGPLEKFVEVARYNFVDEHELLKSKIKKILQKVNTKYKKTDFRCHQSLTCLIFSNCSSFHSDLTLGWMHFLKKEFRRSSKVSNASIII